MSFMTIWILINTKIAEIFLKAKDSFGGCIYSYSFNCFITDFEVKVIDTKPEINKYTVTLNTS